MSDRILITVTLQRLDDQGRPEGPAFEKRTTANGLEAADVASPETALRYQVGRKSVEAYYDMLIAEGRQPRRDVA